MENTKKCCSCLLFKDISLFHKAKNHSKGVSSTCKVCHKEYKKRYYRLNKEKILKQVTAYREENPRNKVPSFYNKQSTANLFKTYLKNARRRAKKTQKDFNLTLENIEILLDSQNYKCSVTHLPITLLPAGGNSTIYGTASLDRIDNTKGYTLDNIQWVALGVNYMKNRHSNEDLLIMIDLIRNIKS